MVPAGLTLTPLTLVLSSLCLYTCTYRVGLPTFTSSLLWRVPCDDALADSCGAGRAAARCQCALVGVGRLIAVSGVCPGRDARTLRWAWDSLCEHGVVAAAGSAAVPGWHPLVHGPAVFVAPLPEELFLGTTRCIHSGQPWDLLLAPGPVLLINYRVCFTNTSYTKQRCHGLDEYHAMAHAPLRRRARRLMVERHATRAHTMKRLVA